MNPYNLLVYTDMDGSLLDHYTYSHAAADSTLGQLEKQNIPVIANTSKTRAELEKLRQELNNSHPFIAENGAAVFLPKKVFLEQPDGTESSGDYWVKAFSKPRSHWQALIAELEPDFPNSFTTFAGADVDGIVEMTGLDTASAKLAAEREYGEPIKWLGSEDKKRIFFEQLKDKGAHILHGGRFSHVSGACDKGAALTWLSSCYAKYFNNGQPFATVALGDSQNDVAMLDAADYAVIIKSPAHPAPSLHSEKERTKSGTLSKTSNLGPEGWVQGINDVLGKIEST